ncbi:MAG: GDP-L-fucose synthase [Planctomycetota bacterium]|jgi:GDP-L-fucose synthase|nr:GDP-L-fucose synthase [Planctomycetota bacterium]
MSFPFRRLFIAGHQGMVGASVCRLLQSQHPEVELVLRSRQDLDLTQASQVDRFFQETKPDAVIFAAAKVGGILANASFPVEFLSENVRMAINAIESAYRSGVQRFLFLGSTCIYPKHAPQPLCEPSLLSSPLESTNEAYALAKIVGLKLCQYYRTQFKAVYHSAMPTNLYGPGDNYHPEHSHVIPGLLRRIHEAKVQNAPTVTLWGSGTPRREFLYVDDLARALVHLLTLDSPPDWINVGTGEEISILELAKRIAKTVGYTGTFGLDTSKPDGTPLKRTDPSLIFSTGWNPKIELADGLVRTYQDFLIRIERGNLRSK